MPLNDAVGTLVLGADARNIEARISSPARPACGTTASSRQYRRGTIRSEQRLGEA